MSEQRDQQDKFPLDCIRKPGAIITKPTVLVQSDKLHGLHDLRAKERQCEGSTQRIDSVVTFSQFEHFGPDEEGIVHHWKSSDP